ncbi:MAG: porin family protein [Bacteroidales bacterium]|nr:porin family protein [Bacteroidales bacterium]
MKKILAIAAILFAVAVSANAQDKQHGTIMGQNKVNYGVTAGYGTGLLGLEGAAVIDANITNTNLRFRTTVGLMEAWVSPAASVNVQYLLPLFGGLYVYPSVGVYAELHDKSACLGLDEKEFSFGGQFGVGLEYQFSEKVGLFVEGGYQVLTPTASRPAVNAGLMFHFGN